MCTNRDSLGDSFVVFFSWRCLLWASFEKGCHQKEKTMRRFIYHYFLTKLCYLLHAAMAQQPGRVLTERWCGALCPMLPVFTLTSVIWHLGLPALGQVPCLYLAIPLKLTLPGLWWALALTVHPDGEERKWMSCCALLGEALLHFIKPFRDNSQFRRELTTCFTIVKLMQLPSLFRNTYRCAERLSWTEVQKCWSMSLLQSQASVHICSFSLGPKV